MMTAIPEDEQDLDSASAWRLQAFNIEINISDDKIQISAWIRPALVLAIYGVHFLKYVVSCPRATAHNASSKAGCTCGIAYKQHTVVHASPLQIPEFVPSLAPIFAPRFATSLQTPAECRASKHGRDT